MKLGCCLSCFRRKDRPRRDDSPSHKTSLRRNDSPCPVWAPLVSKQYKNAWSNLTQVQKKLVKAENEGSSEDVKLAQDEWNFWRRDLEGCCRVAKNQMYRMERDCPFHEKAKGAMLALVGTLGELIGGTLTSPTVDNPSADDNGTKNIHKISLSFHLNSRMQFAIVWTR